MSVNQPHEVDFHHEEHVLYPAHDDRTESKEFKEARHHLIVVLDTPCFICGVKHSEGARMESHHLFGEYSLSNALDIAKINADHPHFTPNNDLPITSVDSEGNQLSLCEWCHRGKPKYEALHHPRNKHKTAGVHELTFPIWIAQKYRLQGVDILVEAVDK
ncbi:hypothetical protein O9H85_08090 [Paenibacillus filicis]|uniref:HNH endonuclease n=1 Tax=Paenibacillus gyeongsangnamensis TaxID=3388067 RepID=A0ABT4Q6I7_9BACL|nr:hypothetical protein [Paenibacillus filicis]MCZ8512392.1 hypothetical protein [Paenibacillus filicis]